MNKKSIVGSVFAVILALAFTACASSSAAVPHALADASGLDELGRAIRDVSDYLNDNIDAGSMIVFVNVQSESEALSGFIIDDLIANAVNDRIFTVVDRHQLEAIRVEQNFQLSGEVDDNTALGIGRFFGAQTIVSGRVSSLGGHFRLTIRALDVQTAQVQGQYNRNIGTVGTITALIGGGGGQVAQAPRQQAVQVPAQQAVQVPAQAAQAPAQTPQAIVTVQGASLAEKLQWLQANVANNTEYRIAVTRNETISPQTLSFSRARNVTVRLSGSGGERVVSLSGNGTLFTVEDGTTLILDRGITLQGRSGNNASLVRVNSRGTLIMNAGARIYGNEFIASSSIAGGGVHVAGGTFTMNGGEIHGNRLDSRHGGTSHSGNGSGVFVNQNGRFTMNGGEIHGNEGATNGGGVNVTDGNFTMNGGEIFRNTARSGGGVYVWGRGTTFEMRGGEIFDNTASGVFNHQGGGGVSVHQGGTFSMSGGEVSGNTAALNGGGVFVNFSGLTAGIFTKTGGTIFGSDGTSNENRARAGHAVAGSSPTQIRIRANTAGPTVRMDSRQSGAAGGWEN